MKNPIDNEMDEEMMPMTGGGANDRKKIYRLKFIMSRTHAVALMFLGCSALFFASQMRTNKSSNSHVLKLQCSAADIREDNDKMKMEEEMYNGPDAGKGNVDAQNITHFLEYFRNEGFDYWGQSYEEVKKLNFEWKSTMYADYVDEGGSVYESACGIGLNLYMTLEILHQVKGLESLVVFGNEYLADSARKAQYIFSQGPPFSSSLGSICTGDSTRLGFVPSNSFDLVFTGYITPHINPLNLEFDTNKNYDIYENLCNKTDWKSKKLVELGQQRQQDYFAKWVGEMIRIAKPGKAIGVEQNGMPYCQDVLDYGGVHKEWWSSAIHEYDWDVDPASLVVQDTELNERYNVFMRKTS